MASKQNVLIRLRGSPVVFVPTKPIISNETSGHFHQCLLCKTGVMLGHFKSSLWRPNWILSVKTSRHFQPCLCLQAGHFWRDFITFWVVFVATYLSEHLHVFSRGSVDKTEYFLKGRQDISSCVSTEHSGLLSSVQPCSWRGWKQTSTSKRLKQQRSIETHLHTGEG